MKTNHVRERKSMIDRFFDFFKRSGGKTEPSMKNNIAWRLYRNAKACGVCHVEHRENVKARNRRRNKIAAESRRRNREGARA